MFSQFSTVASLPSLTHVATTDAPGAASPLVELGRALQQEGYRFITVTPLTHQRVNARPENAWARNLADVFGWSRPFKEGVLPAHIEQCMRAAGIIEPLGDGWRSTLRASTLGTELFFHSAYPTTAENAVFFGPDTYRFIRAIDAELASCKQPIRRAADIGCGAGPGAIAIATRRPQAAVLAIDINDDALSLTAVNAALAGTPRVWPCHSNLLDDVDGSFDLIVSNPPYLVDSSHRAYRDGGGELGDALSAAIIDAAILRLSPGGMLWVYTGVAFVDGEAPFLRVAAERLERAGFRWRCEEIDPDVFGEELDEPSYARADRIAAVWIAAQKPS